VPDYIPPSPISILISEVMYGGDENEWVEIRNNWTKYLDIGGWSIYSYADDNETQIPGGVILEPYQTYVIGEPSFVNLSRDISLNDTGDVLIINSTSGQVFDVVCWGSGTPSFSYGSQNGWIDSSNATGGLPENSSIFRYSLTMDYVSDTNSSSDWYNTSNPTPNDFYEIIVGDVFFSEIGMAESSEFVEIYNNLTFPITLDGMVVYDFGGSDVEISFTGIIVVPARGVILAGESISYDYYEAPITLSNYDEDLVLYRDTDRTYVLDVVIWGDLGNTYPRGADTGWIGAGNAKGSGSPGTSLQRINRSLYELLDTNTSADWELLAITPWTIPPNIPPPVPGIVGSVLITEVMIDPTTPETGAEYIELYNTLDTPVNIGNWTIRHNSTWSTADATIPIGTILTAKTHFTILDDFAICTSRYSVSGLYYAESITLNNNPSDAIIVDSFLKIIDRVAWRNDTNDFNDTFHDSWRDNGVNKGNEGNAIARLYDPYNREVYVDTNSSVDWVYNASPSIGNHTNTIVFLYPPIIGGAPDDDDDDDSSTDDASFILFIILLSITIPGIGISLLVIRKKIIPRKEISGLEPKKRSKRTPKLSTEPQKTKSPFKPKKLKESELIATSEYLHTIEEVEEQRRTESEVEVEKQKILCLVHKGEIDGAVYICPTCKSYYCFRCAKALRKKKENCWACENEIKL
jgi:hypothetical protein